jgi:hypothetical protein
MCLLNEVTMTQVLRIILAILTLLTTLAMAGGSVWSFATGKPALLGVVCGLLAVGFSFFVKNDYNYFFGKKS